MPDLLDWRFSRDDVSRLLGFRPGTLTANLAQELSTAGYGLPRAPYRDCYTPADAYWIILTNQLGSQIGHAAAAKLTRELWSEILRGAALAENDPRFSAGEPIPDDEQFVIAIGVDQSMKPNPKAVIGRMKDVRQELDGYATQRGSSLQLALKSLRANSSRTGVKLPTRIFPDPEGPGWAEHREAVEKFRATALAWKGRPKKAPGALKTLTRRPGSDDKPGFRLS